MKITDVSKTAGKAQIHGAPIPGLDIYYQPPPPPKKGAMKPPQPVLFWPFSDGRTRLIQPGIIQHVIRREAIEPLTEGDVRQLRELQGQYEKLQQDILLHTFNAARGEAKAILRRLESGLIDGSVSDLSTTAIPDADAVQREYMIKRTILKKARAEVSKCAHIIAEKAVPVICEAAQRCANALAAVEFGAAIDFGYPFTPSEQLRILAQLGFGVVAMREAGKPKALWLFINIGPVSPRDIAKSVGVEI